MRVCALWQGMCWLVASRPGGEGLGCVLCGRECVG